MSTRFIGRSIIRRPGLLGRWEYLAPGRDRIPLGLGASTNWARWTDHRARARRFETRREARRQVYRESAWSPGLEIVRVPAGTWEELSDADVPRERQHLFPFATSTRRAES
jgi:hypothetical protein